VLGLNKVAASLNPNQTKVLESNIQDNEINDEEKLSQTQETGTETPTPAKAKLNSAPLKPTTNTPTPTQALIAQQNTNNQTGCIITIFGKQYNVDSLINSHPGGNVFACGTDQSTLYQNAHGSSVSRLSAYLVTSGGSISSNGSSSTATNLSQGSGEKSEYEDDEVEFEND